MSDRLLLSFYGDDLTGSCDVMEALALSGVQTALFFDSPSPQLLRERFPKARAAGVAGASRTMTPAQMDQALPLIFEQLAKLKTPIFHYKICSTFDSSPEVGSIGRAIEIGRRIFKSKYAPLLVGAPALRRYCLFGNLFATVGEETFRLDRHPTMSRHPVTPMTEGDLRKHLAKQTNLRIALFDILQQTGSERELDERLTRLLESQPDIVLFDVLDDARLVAAGRLIQSRCHDGAHFVVGSSGVEYALTAYWRQAGWLADAEKRHFLAPPVKQIIVISGSCSPVTKAQIEWAIENGFIGIRLAAKAFADESQAQAERARVRSAALDALAAGFSLLIYTALGPDDTHIASTLEAQVEYGMDVRDIRQRIGAEQGKLLRDLLSTTGLRRVAIAGGDTSSHAVGQLNILALELLAPIAPGSPLCRAASDDPRFDGLEIALKGGQGGMNDYFGLVRDGVSLENRRNRQD